MLTLVECVTERNRFFLGTESGLLIMHNAHDVVYIEVQGLNGCFGCESHNLRKRHLGDMYFVEFPSTKSNRLPRTFLMETFYR